MCHSRYAVNALGLNPTITQHLGDCTILLTILLEDNFSLFALIVILSIEEGEIEMGN